MAYLKEGSMKEIICPACGKAAIECRKYTNGDRNYVHEKKYVSGPFPHWEFTKYCYVKAAS